MGVKPSFTRHQPRNLRTAVILCLLVLAGLPSGAQITGFSDCWATLRNDTLFMGNSQVTRAFSWQDGHLSTLYIQDRSEGYRWEFAGEEPDVIIPGTHPLQDGLLQIHHKAATAREHEHLRITVTALFDSLMAKRVFRVYPDCPAISCQIYLKGSYQGEWTSYDSKGRVSTPVYESLRPAGVHWRTRTVEFSDRTDDHNNLVHERKDLVFTRPFSSRGNLVYIEPLQGEHSLFVLKESPNTMAQLGYPGFDFLISQQDTSHLNLEVCGLNVDPGTLDPSDWIRCSGAVVGVSGAGGSEQITALRDYQMKARVWDPLRDEMIMMNTWGDRGQDSRITEAFCLNEIKVADQLGLTHFQIDDGWQTGRTANSSQQGGSLEGIWERDDYWKVDAVRFPEGLSPVVRFAAEKGIELGMWFNPSHERDYEHWRQDADVVLGLYRSFGIRTFKIDGVVINTKTAETRFRAFLDTLMLASENEIVINLDVTGLSNRPGYHSFYEYGNVFLENRYTDWGNYYPHWTLRNLWMLAKYYPPQFLQVEFLNPWRNRGKYAAGDLLAPSGIPFDYQFAISMMGQPLAWFEGSGLPEKAMGLESTIGEYRQVMSSVHSGTIIPVGCEPSGFSWTGFQSILNGKEGFILVFRENHHKDKQRICLVGLADRRVGFSRITGQASPFNCTADERGGIEFVLPRKWTYALYRYEVLD